MELTGWFYGQIWLELHGHCVSTTLVPYDYFLVHNYNELTVNCTLILAGSEDRMISQVT